MVAEYEAHHARAQASVAAVSQHVSVFVAAVTLLATATIGVAALIWSSRPILALLLVAIGLLSTTFGGALTLFATYRARLQQTESELALSRLRRYFLSKWPHLTPYVAGSIHDDWKTPYAHPWTSNTVRGWLALITLSSVTFGAALAVAATALNVHSVTVLVVLAVVAASAAFTALFLWLWSRLKRRRANYRPQFPAGESASDPATAA